MARYASPWDRSLRTSTTLLVAVAAVICGGFLVLYLAVPIGDDRRALTLALAPLAFAAVLLGTWVLAPRGFTVEVGVVRVERLLDPVEIPLREIRRVELLPDAAMGGVIRTLGASGAFGHYGRFWSRRLGSFRMYATRSTRLVRIVTDRGMFVLSPEPPDRFVQEVLERCPAARSRPGA